MTPIV